MAGVRSGNVGKKQQAVTVWSWTASRLYLFYKIDFSKNAILNAKNAMLQFWENNYKTFLWIKFNFLDERHWTSPLWHPMPIYWPQSDTASEEIFCIISYFIIGVASLRFLSPRLIRHPRTTHGSGGFVCRRGSWPETIPKWSGESPKVEV